MKRFIADANIGLRILVGNQDIQAAGSPEAKSIIERMVQTTLSLIHQVDAGEIALIFPDAVIEEMVFVMNKYYKLDRHEIAAKLLKLIEADHVESSATIREALSLYRLVDLDLVDVKLIVTSRQLDAPILTWDQDLAKHAECECYTPEHLVR